MASRDLSSLVREAEILALEWRRECEVARIDVLVYCTYRGRHEQAALYAQGRESYADVCALRVLAGLVPISPTEAAKMVTNAKAGYSWHNHARAWDAVPMSGGRALWGNAEAFHKMGGIAVTLGIEWGGLWEGSLVDLPHFQVTGGLDIKSLAEDAEL